MNEVPWDTVGTPVLVLDGDWHVRRVNRAAADLLRGGSGTAGWASIGGAASFEGQSLEQLVPAEVVGRLQAGLAASDRGSAGGGEASRVMLAGVQAGARRVPVDIIALRAGEWVVLTLIDVTGRAAAEEEMNRLRARLAESERDRAKLSTLQEHLAEGAEPPVIIGASGALQRVREQVARVAPSDTTVLIQGETGSGKELVARSIHAESGRARRALVAVNCAALPESLIESELFGHERGAFTGADRRRLGKFELADGGTLFLDEVAEMPLQSQAKLLRVLQEGVLERVGGSETVRVDVRVVAATHRDLARRVERNLFREDLFYRLNVFRIDVPPLRERREDLRPLVEYLHERVARRMARPILPISERSMRRIMAYRWPGNIRELANAVERATLLADGPELEVELPESPVPEMGGGAGATGAEWPGARSSPVTQTRDILLDLSLEQLQRLQIMHALESCGYRVFGGEGAASKLDINPSTLLSRMDKFGIPRPRVMRGAGR
ncbi:MAG: sigma-54-dependent Fis family transcriptional regulator [Phycisphaerales bacterium]|nr:sigma-54-dependent Fis family transcriptional regulator [Phycisphaerales bacterium]